MMLPERLLRANGAATTALLLVVRLMPCWASSVVVTVKRLANEGDEFTNPLTCKSACPTDSVELGASGCTCKCLSQFTWRQDEGKCLKSSGCKLTVLSGNSIPAFTIPDKSDEVLLPDHALRLMGSVVDSQDVYRIQDVELLGDRPWKTSSYNDFYIAIVQQAKVSVQKIKSRIQQNRISDYEGTILRFDLKSSSDVGCLMLKIEGSRTYNSRDFPAPVYPIRTDYPSKQPVTAATASTTITGSSNRILKPSSIIVAATNASSSLSSLVVGSSISTTESGFVKTTSLTVTGRGYNSMSPPSAASLYSDLTSTSSILSSSLLSNESSYSKYQSSPSSTVGSISVRSSPTTDIASDRTTTTLSRYEVLVTRLNDGDEVRRPGSCEAPCPMSSSAKSKAVCTCKCWPKFTWRQDLDMCIYRSDCEYTVVDDESIPLLTITSAMDRYLLPDDHMLRYKGNVIHDKDLYNISTFYILSSSESSYWKSADRNRDFYIEQGDNQEQKLKSRIEDRFVDDYSGVLLNFSLTRSGSEVGCMMVKLSGSHKYTVYYETPRTISTRPSGTVFITASLDFDVTNESEKTESSRTVIFAGIAVGVLTLIVLIIVIVAIHLRKRTSKSFEVANHEFASTIFNHTFNNVNNDNRSTFDVTNPLPEESKSVFADRHSNTLATHDTSTYEKPIEYTPRPVSSDDCDDSYEEPIRVNPVMLEMESNAESVTVSSSHGYTCLRPHERLVGEESYSSLLDNSLYEEIPGEPGSG